MTAHLWVAALLAIIAPLEAVARAKDPRVPAGADPGGIAVAIVSTGIDYTLPHIAGRLARDGEGELVGRDFADGDAQPFEAGGDGTAIAEAILTETPSVRLIPVRTDPEQPGHKIMALAFAGQTPARIVLIAGGSPDQDQEHFRQAAQHFKHLLIVLPANATQPTSDASTGLGNVLIAHNDDQQVNQHDRLSPATIAAVRVAGMAAELAASTPGLDGAGLKVAVQQKRAKLAPIQ